MIKFKEVQDQRNLLLLNTVVDLSFGTLWWVKNDLWRQAIPDFDLEHPDANHPAVSLGKKSYAVLTQVVPMLLGSHSNSTGILIKGVNKSEKDSYSFFNVRPCMFQVKNALGGKDRKMIPNTFKQRLTESETTALRRYLKERGVEFDEV